MVAVFGRRAKSASGEAEGKAARIMGARMTRNRRWHTQSGLFVAD